MQTLDGIVAIAIKQLTKYGRLQPVVYFEGTAGGDAVPLPELPEAAKLSLLEAVGFTLATEGRLGELVQVFLLAEGWRSAAPYVPGLATTQPKHDPNRVEVLMVFRYDVAASTRQMAVYDLVRDDRGEVRKLRPMPGSRKEGELVNSPPLGAIIKDYGRGRSHA